jgi:hypothetical protein
MLRKGEIIGDIERQGEVGRSDNVERPSRWPARHRHLHSLRQRPADLALPVVPPDHGEAHGHNQEDGCQKPRFDRNSREHGKDQCEESNESSSLRPSDAPHRSSLTTALAITLHLIHPLSLSHFGEGAGRRPPIDRVDVVEGIGRGRDPCAAVDAGGRCPSPAERSSGSSLKGIRCSL